MKCDSIKCFHPSVQQCATPTLQRDRSYIGSKAVGRSKYLGGGGGIVIIQGLLKKNVFFYFGQNRGEGSGGICPLGSNGSGLLGPKVFCRGGVQVCHILST